MMRRSEEGQGAAYTEAVKSPDLYTSSESSQLLAGGRELLGLFPFLLLLP